MAQIDFTNLKGNIVSGNDTIIDSEAEKIVNQYRESEVDYVSEPHVACCLLLDTSSSMNANGKIAQLNEALKQFKETVCNDEISKRRVEVCVIEFNTDVRVVTPFCSITKFNPPTLKAGGVTNMKKGVRVALEEVHKRVHKYHEDGVDCYKPFVLMITDGEPTDENGYIISDVDDISTLISDRENQGKFGHLRFHAFGVEGADMDLLSKLTDRVLAINNNAFDQVFNWASRSMQLISRSRVSDNCFGVGLTKDMYSYNPVDKDLPWNH